jgi:hypothetical protein
VGRKAVKSKMRTYLTLRTGVRFSEIEKKKHVCVGSGGWAKEWFKNLPDEGTPEKFSMPLSMPVPAR